MKKIMDALDKIHNGLGKAAIVLLLIAFVVGVFSVLRGTLLWLLGI